jgi:hypothetical protein
MSGWLPTSNQQHVKGLVEQKISNYKLNAFNDENEYKKLSKVSPSCLKSGGVKRLSKLFEEKSKTFSRKTNWWLEEKVYKPPSHKSNQYQFSTPLPRNARLSIGKSLEALDSPKPSKLDRIVNELLQKELTYIEALKRGIDNYVSIIKAGGNDVPVELRNQTFRLFGNIGNLRVPHKFSLPSSGHA